MQRIEHLDSFRGIAILLVVGYHCFSRWGDILPYGDDYSFFIFNHGWLGVQLFFLISGFVILMTLERTQTIKSFLVKRWLRLFPAMFIASVFIYLSSFALTERPAGDVSLRAIIPGITFISSAIWNNYLNITMPTMEGAFWSLYVEAYFYLFIALVYYKFTKQHVTWVIFTVYLVSVGYLGLINQSLSGSNESISKAIIHFGSIYYGWFSAGTAFYLYTVTEKNRWFFIGIAISTISAFFMDKASANAIVYAIVIAIIFAYSFKLTSFQALLNNRFFLFLGFISYPLYLIHENAMISMIIQMGAMWPNLPNYIYPLIALFIVIAVAVAITALEPLLRTWLKRKLPKFLT